MESMRVAKMGYEAFQRNERVDVTGGLDLVMSSLVPLLPRTVVLKPVRSLQPSA